MQLRQKKAQAIAEYFIIFTVVTLVIISALVTFNRNPHSGQIEAGGKAREIFEGYFVRALEAMEVGWGN